MSQVASQQDKPHETAGGSVLDLMKQRTRELHTRAERTGIMRAMLRGEGSRRAYVLLLQNLLPVYRALEEGLQSHAGSVLLGELAAVPLVRAAAIAQDLDALAPDDPPGAPVPSALVYAETVRAAAAGEGSRLIAHAYTRYLGDLSGGQILRRLLGESLSLRDSEMNFYDFSTVGGPDLKERYRILLEQAAERSGKPEDLIAEARQAFRHNIAVSEAIAALLSQ